MPFVKVVKTKAYSKRFQVKFRRRRECKTDYYARTRMVVQDKNKYNTPKYRLVVRISNNIVTCQIAYATLDCDRIFAAAYSSELSKYGANVTTKGGQKNYAACYATGLLLARRVLQKINLDKSYVGVVKADGLYYRVKQGAEEKRSPFKVFLDVGLTRTTTGSRVFGAMKGAVDGGLFVPHKPKRFPGNKAMPNKFDPKTLRKYIYGVHVADYMKTLQAKNPEKYKKQFSRYIAAGKGPDDVEKMWTSVHANIRADPKHVKVERKNTPKKVVKHKRKLNNKERKNRIKQKIAAAKKPTNI
jgi:large subunit ribosomal protein L5e